MINFREKWRGYLWQGRFSSYVMDEKYLYSAVKYILNNPVRAKIVRRAEEYEWSSIRHHLGRENIPYINDDMLHGMIDDWGMYLTENVKEEDVEILRKHERTGRPLGNKIFIEKLEKKLGMKLKEKETRAKKEKITN